MVWFWKRRISIGRIQGEHKSKIAVLKKIIRNTVMDENINNSGAEWCLLQSDIVFMEEKVAY